MVRSDAEIITNISNNIFANSGEVMAKEILNKTSEVKT